MDTSDRTGCERMENNTCNSEFVYDAYVCHATTEKEREFVKMLSETLAHKPYNLRLFLPERDLTDSSNKEEISNILKLKCKRMIFVMSKDYCLDTMADYTLKTAFGFPGRACDRLIVPVMIEPCQVPDIISHLAVCDFSRLETRHWFFPRLAHSLQAPVPERGFT